MLNLTEVNALLQQLSAKVITPQSFFEACKKEGLWLCLNTEEDPILSLEVIEGEDNVIATLVIDGDLYEAFHDMPEVAEV